MSAPYSGRLTTVSATLEAERLLAAFDNREPEFGALFYTADRDVFGAVIAYASAAIREVAAINGTELVNVRQALRLRISQLQANNERNEN